MQKNERSNCQYPLDHRKTKIIQKKIIYFCFIDYAKAFDSMDHHKLQKILKEKKRKFLKRQEYQTISLASLEICVQVKNEELILDMGHWTGSKLGKEYIKTGYCHPAYLTYMKSTHEKCQAG